MNGITMALPNEQELLRQVSDDPAAFTKLYEYYFPRIYNYIRYRVQDATVADDLTIRTFERALQRLNKYDSDKGAFAAWLFIIARNSVNDYFRAEKRNRWLSLDAIRGRASDSPEPEEVVISREKRMELLEAVAQLSERERDLLALKFGAGLTNRHIVELTGLSESNIAVILYRTLRKLRKEFSEEG
jgi:RNA polymerase sigma-70 factor (ECF subfamily)